MSVETTLLSSDVDDVALRMNELVNEWKSLHEDEDDADSDLTSMTLYEKVQHTKTIKDSV